VARRGTSKARRRTRTRANGSSHTRTRRLAAGVLGGLLMVPPTVVGGSTLGFLPVAATGLGSTPLPGAGDVLRALAGSGASTGEDLGASGRLPEADTLSPDLLAALTGPTGPTTGTGPLATVPPSGLGIPGIVLEAYRRAEQRTATTTPTCGVHWSVLAAIGRIESGHARGGRVDINGKTLSPILGPQLSGGPGIAAIGDSDDGRLDGDTTWDRAVGPMQFIPTTWARFATDGNDDGLADPHNVYDATLAAARYLCSGAEDLRDPAALARAIFRYNHSDSYVANVLTWAAAYAAGVDPLPSEPGTPIVVPPVTPPPTTTTPPPGTTPPTSSPSTTSPPTSNSPTTTTPPRQTSTPRPQPPTSSTTTTSPETTTTSPGSGPSTTCTPPTTTTTAPTTTTPPEPPCTEAGPADPASQAPPSETTTSMQPT
jgi:hypothetical protein